MTDDTTVLWGVVADEFGLARWVSYSAEQGPSGHLRAQQIDEWASDPANMYATAHRWPMSLKWQHRERIGEVVALRRAHGKLLAVAETSLLPSELDELTELVGDLRFSSATGHRPGEHLLRLMEVSLTPRPASVGLPAVKWYRHGVSRGNLPDWVRADLARGRKARLRHADTLEVYQADAAPDSAERSHRGADGHYRHDPREVLIHGGGYVLAVGVSSRRA